MINDKTNAPVAVPDERAAFDAINLRDYFGGPISFRERDIAFMAWQARAALAATPAALSSKVMQFEEWWDLGGNKLVSENAGANGWRGAAQAGYIGGASAAAAPVVLPEPMRETLEEAVSVLSSINQGKKHEVKVGDEVCYWQRKEWIDWAEKEVLPKVRALLAQAAAPAAPAVDAETIHLQDLKNAIADCKELRQQVRLLDEQQAGSVWRWQADGQDQLETMGNNMGVLIRACDLRVLLAGGVSMETAPEVPKNEKAFEHFVSDCDGSGIKFDGPSYERGFLTGKTVGADEAAPTVDALDAKDRECIAIGRTIQRAAGELPVDGEIRIDIENGAGAVYVLEPKHGDWRYIDSSDVLSAQINAAIDAANAAAKGAA